MIIRSLLIHNGVFLHLFRLFKFSIITISTITYIYLGSMLNILYFVMLLQMAWSFMRVFIKPVKIVLRRGKGIPRWRLEGGSRK
jgi:hypothetical protein